MESYMGKKIVKTEPMDKFTFQKTVKGKTPSAEEKNYEGYFVQYEDGYKSWSPMIFGKPHQEITKEEKKLTGQ